jgi:hypothetical protein
VIEDELRDLLTDRAASVPDNPTRTREVHARVAGIRRRRTIGAALALILVAVAGLVLLRLPGRPDALPPSDRNLPAPPYFVRGGGQVPAVPGYSFTAVRPISGPEDFFLLASPPPPVRQLIVVRCPRPGSLVVRNTDGTAKTVPCDRRVADHAEGAAILDPGEADRLFAQSSGTTNVRLEPSGPGNWVVGFLEAGAPDELPSLASEPERPVVNGVDHPDGQATLTFTVPAPPKNSDPPYGFSIDLECLQDVRLELTLPGGPLPTLICDAQHGLTRGRLGVEITKAEMAERGLRVGDRVTLTIRSVGAHRDQWRLYPITQ